MSDAPPAPPPPPATTQTAVVPRRRNGAGTTALVLGVLSVVLAALVLFAGLAVILGPLAIIFGIVGTGRASRGEADNRGQAIAGIVLGAVSLLIVLALGISIAQFAAQHSGDFRRFGNCMRLADDDRGYGQCFRELGDELDR